MSPKTLADFLPSPLRGGVGGGGGGATRSVLGSPHPHPSRASSLAADPAGGREIEAHRIAAGAAAGAAASRPPRIFASSSAVGHESAGRPNLICMALTAVRLCWPITPSTLPTFKPGFTRNCRKPP